MRICVGTPVPPQPTKGTHVSILHTPAVVFFKQMSHEYQLYPQRVRFRSFLIVPALRYLQKATSLSQPKFKVTRKSEILSRQS